MSIDTIGNHEELDHDFVTYTEELEELVELRNEHKAEMEALNKKISKIRTEALPELASQLGQDAGSMESGHKWKLSKQYEASLPNPDDTYELTHPETGKTIVAHRREDALNKLIEYNEQASITNNVVIAFSRAEFDEAMRAVKVLKEAGFEDIKAEQTVHAGTLKKIVKERLEKGLDVDLDLFNVHVVRAVSVKLGKTDLK